MDDALLARIDHLLAISCHLSDVDSILPSSPSRRRASTRREHEESEQAYFVCASIIMHLYHRIFLMTLETDMDVKLELKTVMDKIRTLSMGKNKETTVSWVLILRLLVMEYYAVYLLLPRDLRAGGGTCRSFFPMETHSPYPPK